MVVMFDIEIDRSKWNKHGNWNAWLAEDHWYANQSYEELKGFLEGSINHHSADNWTVAICQVVLYPSLL